MCGICFILCGDECCSTCELNCGPVIAMQGKLQPPLRSRGPDMQHELCLRQNTAVSCTHPTAHDSMNAWFYGCVLHIQGTAPAPQPHCDGEGNVLLWNGEVFGWRTEGPTEPVTFELVDGESDTIAVCRYLSQACTHALALTSIETSAANASFMQATVSQAIVAALSKLHGPYAFIFYHKASNGLHFGRDPFGRRSLLLHSPVPVMKSADADGKGCFSLTSKQVIAVSSVAPPASSQEFTEPVVEQSLADTHLDGIRQDAWEEVTIEGIYSLYLNAPSAVDNGDPVPVVGSKTKRYIYTRTAWSADRVKLYRNIASTHTGGRVAANLHNKSEAGDDPAHIFLKTLLGAVHRRVNSMVAQANTISFASVLDGCVQKPRELNKPMALNELPVSNVSADNSAAAASRIGVLFSGGIDSVLLTALLHHTVRSELAIDLLNVTFIKAAGGSDNNFNTAPPSPDRVAAIAALVELQALFPERDWRLVHIDVGEEERYAHEQHIKDLIYPSDTHMDLNIGTAFWFASRGHGYLRSYTTHQLHILLAATADAAAGDEEDEEAGTAATLKSKINRQRMGNSSRPLLRHGAAGAAAGVGRTVSACVDGDGAIAMSASAAAPELVEISPGKFKCVVERCNRVYKAGCERFMCKKCCDAAHRQSALGVDSSTDANKLLFLGARECSEEELFNTCPAHRTKQKQLNKMKNNITAQSRLHQQSPAVESGDCDCDESNEQVESTAEVGEPSLQMPNEMPSAHSDPGCAEHVPQMPVQVPEQIVQEAAKCIPYRSCCKALLVGIGADEQMAGYGRHRTVYLKAYQETLQGAQQGISGAALTAEMAQQCALAGNRALETELNKDLTRLWKRNLGRDDRCISDNGKEAWFPFLDEQVVLLLQSLPVDQIADMSQPQGVGDKRILRGAAQLLGLNQCTELVKRAIQFGTRVAQHTNQHYHGSNRKGKGDAKI